MLFRLQNSYCSWSAKRFRCIRATFRIGLSVATTVVLTFAGCDGSQPDDMPSKTIQRNYSKYSPRTKVREFRPWRLFPPFDPITEFPIHVIEEATKLIDDAELVLAVVIGDEPRAYPINVLNTPQREFFNDTLGSRPIAATW